MSSEDVLWCKVARVISLGARNDGDGGRRCCCKFGTVGGRVDSLSSDG
jgi:hypothetical protein